MTGCAAAVDSQRRVRWQHLSARLSRAGAEAVPVEKERLDGRVVVGVEWGWAGVGAIRLTGLRDGQRQSCRRGLVAVVVKVVVAVVVW